MTPATRFTLAVAGVVAVGFAITFSFVEPPPPRTISIATGSPTGAYAAFATRYAAELARQGITLEVVETAGAVENLALLNDPAAAVDLALVQGGLGPDPASADREAGDEIVLESLASLFFEAVWVFTRDPAVAGLDRLVDARIAIGASGSGTAALARFLLAENGVTEDTATLLDLAGDDAAAALSNAAIDAAVFVSSPRAAVVRRLLADPAISLMSFTRAAAYPQRFSFMSSVVLHAGAADLAAGVPPADVTMPAAAASLVARADLHPSLVPVVLQAVRNVHQPGGFFESVGEFPSAAFVEFPLNDQARRFLDRGPPFLQRFLPFWVANFIDRMIVLLIPLLTLLVPLARLAPPLYHWRMRSRINRVYGALARLEEGFVSGTVDRAAATAELDALAAAANGLRVPASFAGELYTMRFHLDRVRAELVTPGSAPSPNTRSSTPDP